MAFVRDASVAAACALPDQEAELADIALDRLGGETAMVPDLFWHEVRNLLLSAERRGRINRCYADALMVRLRRLPLRRAEDANDGAVMALARAHRPTAYDASYLVLALRQGCGLASLDRRLNEAAASEAVTLFA